MDISARLQNTLLRLNIDDEGRSCRDIPQAACDQQPGNFVRHLASLFLSKSSDGLIDPKLVLSWLITALGGSPAMVGLLVPIREAGALLPQLFIAVKIREMPLRKYAWAGGALMQGLAAGVMGTAALTLSGAAAAVAILLCLTVLALARSVCSVSYKDVLGKTIAKSRRGTVTGLAGSLGAISVIVFAGLLAFDVLPRMALVVGGLFTACALWVAAAAIFSTLAEAPGATEGGGSAWKDAVKNLGLIKSEPQLRRFIIVRALLTATALAPPFMIAGSPGSRLTNIGGLGILVFASALSAFLSSYIWGRLSDRSSRKVLMLSGVVSTTALIASALALRAGVLGGGFVLPVLLFVLMIAYQGVRMGRSTHLVDMANAQTRAAYTAVSNTVIGVVLIAGGGFSVVAAAAGVEAVLWVMAAMCAVAVVAGRGLDEVQAE